MYSKCNTMELNIDDFKRQESNKEIVMSIRTTKEISQFMKKNNISPSSIFHKTIEELIKQQKSAT